MKEYLLLRDGVGDGGLHDLVQIVGNCVVSHRPLRCDHKVGGLVSDSDGRGSGCDGGSHNHIVINGCAQFLSVNLRSVNNAI